MRRTILGGFLVALLVAGSASPASAAATKVVRNGGFESSACGNGFDSMPPKSWARTGAPTVVCWATGGGFPSNSDPGPPNRALGFAAGGDGAAVSTLTQTPSLANLSVPIDAGTATFNMGAYLGGYLSQGDNATMSVTWRDGAGGALGSATIGPVTAADRGNATGLLLRRTNGSVPVGTRSALIVITLTRLSGTYNDGYVDAATLKILTP